MNLKHFTICVFYFLFNLKLIFKSGFFFSLLQSTIYNLNIVFFMHFRFTYTITGHFGK